MAIQTKTIKKASEKKPSAPTSSRVRKAAKAGSTKDDGFTSVAGIKYESLADYKEAKSKHPNSRYSLLLIIVDKLTSKGVKNAKVVIGQEKTLTDKHIKYVAETLPNAVLDLAQNGQNYSIRNRVTKEMPKLDKGGKPNGNTAKKALIEFELIKL